MNTQTTIKSITELKEFLMKQRREHADFIELFEGSEPYKLFDPYYIQEQIIQNLTEEKLPVFFAIVIDCSGNKENSIAFDMGIRRVWYYRSSSVESNINPPFTVKLHNKTTKKEKKENVKEND